MNNEIKKTDEIASTIRLIGSIILIGGIILVGISQLMETTSPNYFPNENDNALQILTDNLNNIKLNAEKTKITILGGFLVVIGLQISLVSNQVVKEIIEQFKKPI